MKNKKKKRKKTAKDIVLDILLVFFMVTAIASAAYLIRYYHMSSSAQADFDNLKMLVDDGADQETTQSSTTEEAGDKEILKKYQALYNKNNDFIGWLSIDNMDVDYPVMYTPEDPQHYLHTDFDGEYSYPGVPFVDYRCNPIDDRSDNVIIYGHNMKSGIMFRALLQYEDEDFYKEHRYIKFDTLYEEAQYEVIGAFRSQVYDDDDTDNYHYYDFINAADKAEFDEFISFVKDKTPYTISASAEYGDELLTLSTCASHVEQGRFVIVAKKVK